MDNQIIEINGNEINSIEISPTLEVSNELSLRDKYMGILQANANRNLNQKQIEIENAKNKANLISSVSQIKSEVFAPNLLDDYSKLEKDITDLEEAIKINLSAINYIENDILQAGTIEEMELLKAKKSYLIQENRVKREEIERKMELKLKILDNFDFKGTFKEARKGINSDGEGFMGMLGAIAGVSAGVSATMTANSIQNGNKQKKKKGNTINQDILNLYNI